MPTFEEGNYHVAGEILCRVPEHETQDRAWTLGVDITRQLVRNPNTTSYLFNQLIQGQGGTYMVVLVEDETDYTKSIQIESPGVISIPPPWKRHSVPADHRTAQEIRAWYAKTYKKIVHVKPR